MLTNLPAYLAWTRKAIIQVLGLATSLLAYGFLPDKYNKWVATAVAVLTTILHFITPNADAPGTGVAKESFGPSDSVPPLIPTSNSSLVYGTAAPGATTSVTFDEAVPVPDSPTPPTS